MLYCMKCGTKLVQGKCSKCDIINISEETKKQKNASKGKKDTKPKVKKKGKSTRKKKLIIICVAIGVVVAIGAVVLGLFLNKDSDYDDAIAMLENGEPKEAAEIFEDLGSFKESENYLKECNDMMTYFEAVETMQDKDYEDAIGMFAALGDYEDSQELIQLSQNNIDYEMANVLFDTGDFVQAQMMFIALANFNNSAQLVLDCQVRLDYAEATMLFEAGYNLSAKLLFETILDFEDSQSLALICGYRLTYDDAIKKIDEDDFEGALVLLNGIKKDVADAGIDFETVMDQSKFDAVRNDSYKHVAYNKGKSFFDQVLFYSAYLEFVKASGLLDADELAQSCAQPIETKEIYENPDYASNKVSVTFSAPDVSGTSVCVKVYSGSDLASMLLIKAGEKIRVKLPDGTFRFNIGNGENWYGEKEFFGDEGYYFEMIIDESLRLIEDFPKVALLIPIYYYTFTLKVDEDNTDDNSINRHNF